MDVRLELQRLSDECFTRVRARLDGLSDEEYLWEPAPGCWTIRPRDDGRWVADWPLPSPEVEPFTTIAWRLWHLIDMYGEDRAPRWLDVPPQGPPIGLESGEGAPPTAAAARALLDRAHARWDAHLALVDDERLGASIGPVAGPQYADSTRAAYVLHMLDEFIHHGAEIALLRDLWRWQHPVAGVDAVTDKVMRGDRSAVDDLPPGPPPAELLVLAASYARWDLVLELAERGAPLSPPGRTALHLAAGAGELAVVRALLDHGADPTARDDVYRATPLEWADFLHQPAVVALLRDLPGDRPGRASTQ
jgi:hypothetical protein